MHPAPHFRTIWHVAAVVIDMLAVGCATLFYDGVVAAVVFGIEFARDSKSADKPSETVGVVVTMGLVVGGLAAGSLLLNRKYYRALAVLVGLLPLALLAQLVHSLSKGH